jgi:hypothetical protein
MTVSFNFNANIFGAKMNKDTKKRQTYLSSAQGNKNKSRTTAERKMFRRALSELFTEEHFAISKEFFENEDLDPNQMLRKDHRDLYYTFVRLSKYTCGLGLIYFGRDTLIRDLKRMSKGALIQENPLFSSDKWSEFDAAVETALEILFRAKASVLEALSEEGFTATAITQRRIH